MGFQSHFGKIYVGLLFALIGSTSLLADAVLKPELPDSIPIPVTFFDFHSDGSNPEFQAPHTSGTYLNMASRRLTPNGVPDTGSAPYLNYYFKYWYTDWNSPNGGKGDKTMPDYSFVGGEYNANVIYNGTKIVDHDTAFKNIVIHDTLIFRLVDSARGLYRFEDNSFFPLDGKGFGSEKFNHNFSFTMKLHTEFTYNRRDIQFNFTGDDDVWAYINGNLALDLGGIHSKVSGTIDSTTFRRLNIPFGSNCTLDFFYAERHTSESNIMIETNLIQKSVILDLKAEPDKIVVYGDSVTLIADAHDEDGNSFPDLSKLTKWRVLPNPVSKHSNADFSSDSGASVIFRTHTPYDTIKIEGSVSIEGVGTVTDTITIIVIAGPDCKISIENEIVSFETSPSNLIYQANPIDTIYITGSTSQRHAYAVVRDCNGVFKRMASAENTIWSAAEPIISVEGEAGRMFHATIKRLDPMATHVTLAFASEGTLIPGSVPVKLDNWTVEFLRVVPEGGSPVADYISSIVIETDSSQKYEVYGKISTASDPDDPASYVKLPCKWELTAPINFGLIMPEYSTNWLFEPIKPGDGVLTVTNTDDPSTTPLAIPVRVLRSAPSNVKIELLTPAPERIAGQPIKAHVIIENKDGRVPGTYCFGDGNPVADQVVYQDRLSRGGERRPEPTMTVDGVQNILNTSNGSIYKHNQCFVDGIDTVEFVLYYAPKSDIQDSLHQITVVLDPKLVASTERFSISAARLDSLVLTHDKDGKNPITDVIVVSSNNSTKVIYSQGYDEYGNYIGNESSQWYTDGPLPPIDSTYRPVITYIHSNPVEEITGKVCARIIDTVYGVVIEACATVIERGQTARIMTALTRDINGNGFLDRIDIFFSKDIVIPPNSNQNFAVALGLTNFVVDSIVPLSGNSIYGIYIQEVETKMPQTDWQPNLTMVGIDGTTDEISKIVSDGAAPVVWKVTKKIQTRFRRDDIVTIELSENIQGVNNSAFNYTQISPDSVFRVYYQNSDKQFIEVKLFEGTKFENFDGNKTFQIRMTNNLDITNLNWVNIKYETEQIFDLKNNKPDIMNQKVQVDIEGIEPIIEVGPNPFPPKSTDLSPGKIKLVHDQYAFEKIGNGGTIFVITLPLPLDGSKVYISLKVYDVAGNVVNYSGRVDILEDLFNQGITLSELQGASLFTLKYLWPGASRKGMRLSPGAYKGVVSVDYDNPSFHDIREIKFIGVKK